MFRDGNNQALQLVMQGYSDSIRAKTSNQGVAMANAFNQGLSNAVQTHDNHEQAMQNREMTRLQNEYMNKTMDDRVRHQAQQTKANDLANEYTERTLDDRVAHQEQQTIANGLANESQWLNNNFQAMKNDTFKRTQESDIGATNAINYSKTADAQKQKTITEYEHAAYKGTEQPLQDENGNYYLARYDKENGKSYRQYIHEDDARRRIETNAQAAATRKATTQGETSRQQANTTGLQAQTAQNTFNMKMGDQQNKMYDEAKTAIQASGDTYDDIVYKLGEAARNGESQITLRNGTKMSVEMASMLGNGMLRGNSGGIGGGVNVKNDIKTTFKADLKNALDMLKNPNATPEQLSSARSALLQDKDVKAFNYKVNSYAHLAENAQDITEQDRLKTFQGFVTQYLGGEAASVYGNLKAKESMLLTGLATNALKGTLTERDMQIVKKQVQDLRKSGGFNEGVLKAMLDKMIHEIQAGINTYETPNILAPENLKRFESIKVLRQALG